MSIHADRIQTRRDDPEALAKHAISLLERHFHTAYGIEVKMGFELEFLSKHPDWVTPEENDADTNPYRLNSMYENHRLKKRFTPACKKQDSSTRWFLNSPSLAYFYKEDISPSPKGNHVYEMVFTHLADYGPTVGWKLNNHAAEMLVRRDQIMGYKKRCPTSALLGKPYKEVLSFPEEYFPNGSFQPILSSSRYGYISNCITMGLHVNVSFQDSSTGKYLMRKISDCETADEIARSFWKLATESLWLIAPENANYERLKERDVSLEEDVRCRVGYVENKIPAANSNPYYAILLNLVAIEHVFKECDAKTIRKQMRTKTEGIGTEESKLIANNQPLPKTLEKARAAFHSETMLRDTLNRLEPNLGDRFHAAILVTPPGMEQSAYRPAAKQTARAR